MGLLDRFRNRKNQKDSEDPGAGSRERESDSGAAPLAASEEETECTGSRWNSRERISLKFAAQSAGRTVVAFEERKKTCIPSAQGLYVAEILLLDFCSRGEYPLADGEYPQFWWTEYGIRDVDAVLKSLEERGFLRLETDREFRKSRKSEERKEFLKESGEALSEKKSELARQALEPDPVDDPDSAEQVRKYVLTEAGKQELEDNAYVPYMDSHAAGTPGYSSGVRPFNVWSINQALGQGDRKNWRAVVDREKQLRDEEIREQQAAGKIQPEDPERYRESLEASGASPEDRAAAVAQSAEIRNAENRYRKTGNLEEYITFWEKIWAEGGLVARGSKADFTLADLYVKAGRYDDALAFLKKLRTRDSDREYTEYADRYMAALENLAGLQGKKKSR